MTTPIQDRLRRTNQVREMEEIKAINERMIQGRMWSRQGAIFQETALQVLDQRGSKAHQAIGPIVTQLNALGEIDTDAVIAAVKDAMARWSQLLWTD